jgi:hypothetical protein
MGPSRRASITAAVARFASGSFVRGKAIDAEQSITTTWAAVGMPPWAGPRSTVTEMTASTTRLPRGRYLFW